MGEGSNKYMYIEATEKEIVRHRYNRIPAIEITSYEQLNELPIGSEVAIMHCCEMVIGKIQCKDNDFILIYDNQGMITVNKRSFEYRNFLYKLA